MTEIVYKDKRFHGVTKWIQNPTSTLTQSLNESRAVFWLLTTHHGIRKDQLIVIKQVGGELYHQFSSCRRLVRVARR